MRNGMFLEAYAADYDVTVLVLPIYPPVDQDWEFLRAHAKAATVVSRGDERDSHALRTTAGSSFDVVHVSRLVSVPILMRYASTDLQSVPFRILDVDDFESKRARRFAALRKVQGADDAARSDEDFSSEMQRLERAYLPLFNRLFMTHEADARELAQEYDLPTVRAVPNAVRLPPRPRRRTGESSPTLLFVGTLDYWPNADAVTWFCTTVLPKLKQLTAKPFKVVIAGARPPQSVQCLANNDVRILGYVENLQELYADAAIAIVPLRTGAGTRVKILEAVSYGVPTVSTAIGAEGLDFPPEKGVLIADDPGEFALLCSRLLHDHELRHRVGNSGAAWVEAHYDLPSFQRYLRRALSP